MKTSIPRRHILGFLSATSCGSLLSNSAFAQAAGNAVIYTSNNQQAVQAITDVAKSKAANLKLSFVTGGSGVLLKRMETEASAPQADIFW